MTDLSDFLLARIAEDEALYRGAMHMGCVEDTRDPDDVIHSATCPNRVLADCDAKRRIVVRAQELLSAAVPMAVHLAQQTLIDLARPYAGHPDYDKRWRP